MVAIALVSIVGLASLGKHDAAKGEDLIASVQREEAGAADAGTSVAKNLPTASRLPPAPASPAGVDAADTAPAASAVQPAAVKRKKPPSDAADIDKELSERFGRPTVLPDGTLEHASAGQLGTTTKGQPTAMPKTVVAQKSGDDDVPDWLKPVPPEPAPANKALGIPSGTHIRARLETNLDSRTVADGPIEAKLMRPLYVETHAVLPSGTVLYGHAQVSGSRFTIHFYRLRLPGMREVPFEALAYDASERKPGLPPSRTTTTEAPKQEGAVSKIAKGAATTLLTATATGGLPSTLAAGAGQSALDSTSDQGQQQPQTNQLLFLDAGIDFDAFVVTAF